MINLVPPEFKKRQKVRSKIYFVVLVYIVATTAVVLGWAGLTTLNLISTSRLGDKEAQLSELTNLVNQKKNLVSKATFIQDRIASSAQYQPNYDWNLVLDAIAASTPTDSTLTKINITSDDKTPPKVNISGKSSSRRSIILFKEKLATTDPFTSASISSISDEITNSVTSYSFTIVITMKKAAL